MKPEFFCCIGAELKDEIAGSLKSSRIFMYRAAESQTIADMLVDGFFNEADDLRLNDLILLYCPEQSRAITYAKVSSVSGGVVKTSSVNISPEDIPIDTTGYSNISGSNLQQIINSIDAEFNKYLKLDGSSTMTGVLKMRASVSFECAIAPYWHGVGFYKLNDNDSVTLLASMEATDGFEPGTNNTYNIGSTSKKWKNLYLSGKAYVATINNGADISVPTTSGTMALTSDIAIKSSEAEITSPIQNQVLKYNGSKWVNATVQDLDSVITNCIIEIPQDIKLELNSGTLKLKAGSKVYVPNGVDTFDEVVIASDLTTTGRGTNYTGTVYYDYTHEYLYWFDSSADVSGTTPSGDFSYYNTSTNKIYRYVSGTQQEQLSFPLAHITVSGGVITSIDQVFNGCGFIGNAIYVLPGVKGMAPNGRNADGTLKNQLITVSSVLTSFNYATSENRSIILTNTPILQNDSRYFYNAEENKIYWTGDGKAYIRVILGSINVNSSSQITSMTLKTPFHAVDYSDVAKVGFTGSYNDLTSRPTDLFDNKWSDHLLSNSSWLRADSFSWNSGTTYSVAYQHLVADIAGKTLQSETVGGVTVQFYLADDGHKICPATEETNVSNIYTATGVAWYYVLDTGNTRFKLPRTKFGITGFRDTVGKYVPETLPDHNHNLVAYDNIDSGSQSWLMSENGNRLQTLPTTYASASNSVYQNGAPVQQRATQMYLYFYVGTFSNSALENTAGLNASLFSGKADTNLLNTDVNVDFVVESQEPTALNDYTWYRKYKSGRVDQGGYIASDNNSYPGKGVTLPVPMNDANYQVQKIISQGAGINIGADYVADKSSSAPANTTTTVYLSVPSTYYGFGIYWEVKGKAA